MEPEMQEFSPDIVTVEDDEGNVHMFEALDRIEDDDDKRYVALIPYYDPEEPEALLEGSAELIVLKVEEDEEGETYLCAIENDDEFDRISRIFEERLAEQDWDIVDEDDIVIDEFPPKN